MEEEQWLSRDRRRRVFVATLPLAAMGLLLVAAAISSYFLVPEFGYEPTFGLYGSAFLLVGASGQAFDELRTFSQAWSYVSSASLNGLTVIYLVWFQATFAATVFTNTITQQQAPIPHEPPGSKRNWTTQPRDCTRDE